MASLGQVEGIALAENLVIPVLWANSEKIPYAVHEVAVRDDDDNNLANETPHMAEIRAAAERHGLEWALQDDATPPTVQIVSPLPGALLAGVASLLVRAQDNVHVESVAVLIAGQVRGFGNPSSNQDPIEFNTCPIPGGPYTLKAVVYDWKDLAGSHEISVRIANGSNPPISDLSAMAPSPGSVELNWTSPATAANPMAYDVRYAPFPLTDANWDTDGVTPVLTGVPLPKSNTRQTMIVNAQIHESRNYFFAIKIINPCGIASSLSNVASINTPTLRTGLFVIASIPPPQAYWQVLYRYQIQTNLSGQRLVYGLPQAPSNMRVNSAGQVEWIPDLDQEGSHPIRILVTNLDTGQTAQQDFSIAVSQGLSIPAHPRFKKMAQIPIDGDVHAAWVYGDFVYVTNATKRLLEIFNISDPRAPIHAATVRIGSPEDGLWVYRNRVYVPQSSITGQSLLIIHVEDPRNPRVESFVKGEVMAAVHTVNLNNGFAYLSHPSSGLSIVDVRSPSAPAFVHQVLASLVHETTAFGNRAYTANALLGTFSIYDVTNPRNPALLGELPTSNGFAHDAWPSRDGKILLTTNETAIPRAPQLSVWDISNPAVPSHLSDIRGADFGINAMHPRVHLRDSHAFVSYYTAGAVLWDAADFRDLKLLDRYDTNTITGLGYNGAISICPYGKVIAVGDVQTGLWLFELVGPDTTPPTVSIGSPCEGDFVRRAVPIVATASDESGIAWVRFRVDGGQLGGEITSAPYMLDWNTTASSFFEGAHTLTAVARDNAGNEAVSAPIRVIVDNTPPTVPTGFNGRAVSSSEVILT